MISTIPAINRPDRSRPTTTIEAKKNERVIFKYLLIAFMVPRGSGNPEDYKRAKKIAGRVAMSTTDYQEMANQAKKWVGVK